MNEPFISSSSIHPAFNPHYKFGRHYYACRLTLPRRPTKRRKRPARSRRVIRDCKSRRFTTDGSCDCRDPVRMEPTNECGSRRGQRPGKRRIRVGGRDDGGRRAVYGHREGGHVVRVRKRGDRNDCKQVLNDDKRKRVRNSTISTKHGDESKRYVEALHH